MWYNNFMKKLVLLLGIFVLSSLVPAFAVMGYYEGINTDENINYYDTSEYDAYCRKLEDDYNKKYYRLETRRNPEDGSTYEVMNCIAPPNAYYAEVIIPQFDALKYFRDGQRDYIKD